MDEKPSELTDDANLPQVRRDAPVQQQPSLEDLVRLAGPLAEKYFDKQAEAHKREITYETKVLDHEISWRRALLRAGVFVAAGLFGIAGLLFYRGRDEAALDLIKLVVALSGAAFGGYGIARAKRERESDE